MMLRVSSKKIIQFIVVISPLIDIANAMIRVNDISMSLSAGQIVRSLLAVLIAFELFINDKRSFIIMAGAMTFSVIRGLVNTAYGYSFVSNVFFDFRYIYTLGFSLLIYSAYKKQYVSVSHLYHLAKQYVMILAVVTIITNTLQFGIEYATTRRLFTEVNALTAILVWGSSVFMHEFFIEKMDLQNLLKVAITVYATFSQATKTGIIGVIVSGVYLIFYITVKKKNILKFMVAGVAGLLLAVMLYNYFSDGSGITILKRWQYFYNNMDLTSFLLSGRNTLLRQSYIFWIKKPRYILFGMNYPEALENFRSSGYYNYAGPEMDIFDLFFYFGLFIAVPITLILIKRFIKALIDAISTNKRNYHTFPFVILCIVSFLGGHVLSSPMSIIVFIVALIIAEGEGVDTAEKKRHHGKCKRNELKISFISSAFRHVSREGRLKR